VLLAGRILDCTVAPPDINTQGRWEDLEDLELRYGELPDDQMTFLVQVAYGVRDYMGAGPGEASFRIPPPPAPGSIARAHDAAAADPTSRCRRATARPAGNGGLETQTTDYTGVANCTRAGMGQGSAGTEGASVSMRTVVELLMRIHLNAIVIVDDDLRPVGTGLYLLASHVRHSCEPNCAISFNGVDLQLFAVRDVRRIYMYITCIDICTHTHTHTHTHAHTNITNDQEAKSLSTHSYSRYSRYSRCSRLCVCVCACV
jgi:hypothetical protein